MTKARFAIAWSIKREVKPDAVMAIPRLSSR